MYACWIKLEHKKVLSTVQERRVIKKFLTANEWFTLNKQKIIIINIIIIIMS